MVVSERQQPVLRRLSTRLSCNHDVLSGKRRPLLRSARPPAGRRGKLWDSPPGKIPFYRAGVYAEKEKDLPARREWPEPGSVSAGAGPTERSPPGPFGPPRWADGWFAVPPARLYWGVGPPSPLR